MAKNDLCGSRDRLSNPRRFIIIISCFCECLFFGGSFFGWASLSFILVQDGVYSHLCGNHSNHQDYTDLEWNNSHDRQNHTLWDGSVPLLQNDITSCPEQGARLSLAFMIGLVMFGLGALPFGWLFDRFGLWVLRTIAWVFAVVGHCFYAFAHDDLSWMVFPGCALVAVSCNIMVLTACHICELAGKRMAMCVTVYNGGLNASTVAYLLLKVGYEHGLSRRNILLTYIAAWTIVPVISLTLLPRHKVTSPLTYDVPDLDHSEEQPVNVPLKQVEGSGDMPPRGVQGLMRTALYGSLVAWLATMHMRVGAFIGLYNGWLSQLVNGDMKQVSHYINVLGIVQTCGFVFSPLSGILIDWQRKAKKDLNLKGMYKAILALPSVAITTVAAILLSVFVLIPGVKVLYVTILMSEALRTFTYGTAIAVLNMCFPAEHYGVLFGGMYFILGLSTTLQVPYTILAERYGFTPVNGWLLFASVTTILLPIVIIIRHVRRKDLCGSRDKLSNTRRFIIIISCFCECLFFGGSFFGWASLSFILVQDGVYSHLCGNHSNRQDYTDLEWNNSHNDENHKLWNGSVPLQQNDTMSCPEQDAQLRLAFMIGLVMYGLGALPSGWLFDRFGLWVLRTMAWVFAIVGHCFFAFAHDDLSWMVFPGCALVAVSCNIIVLTACHICELAGKRMAMCVTVYNGGVNASTVAYLLLKVGYEHGLSRHSVLLAYIAAWTIVPVISLSLLPRHKVMSPLAYNIPDLDNPEEEPVMAPLRQEEGSGDVPPERVQRLMWTALYGSLVAWLATMHMRVGAFIGFYNGWLTQLINGDMNQVSHYINVLGIVQTCGFVFSPLSGILIDWQRKAKKDLNLKGMYKAILALPSVAITTVAAILLSVFVLIPGVKVLYVTILMSEALRTFTYGTAIAVLNMCFPAKHYGVLFGGMYFILGLSTTLQVLYTILAERYGFTPVNGWLLFASVTTIVLPIVIIVRHVRR